MGGSIQGKLREPLSVVEVGRGVLIEENGPEMVRDVELHAKRVFSLRGGRGGGWGIGYEVSLGESKSVAED